MALLSGERMTNKIAISNELDQSTADQLYSIRQLLGGLIVLLWDFGGHQVQLQLEIDRLRKDIWEILGDDNQGWYLSPAYRSTNDGVNEL